MIKWGAGLAVALLLVLGFSWAMEFGQIPERLRGVSDAWWWSAAPWVILALLWIGIAAQFWKHYRRRREA